MSMRNMVNCRFFAITMMAVATMALTSCKMSADGSTKALADIAAKYQTKCPEKEPNGTTLDSVIFKNDTLMFQISLSNKQLETVNLDSAKKDIAQGVTENMRYHLVNGNCCLAYKYVAPKRTSTIVITPDELKNAAPEKTDK